MGFLGRDAESKQTSTGRAYAVFSVATSLTKGMHLQVEGELRTREWTEKVGKAKVKVKHRIAEMRVDSILKLDRAEKDHGEAPADAEPSDGVPF